jgi:YHS domain-containing protein
MKLLALAAGLILAFSVLTGVRVLADNPTTAPATQPMIYNKICPVTKEAVDPKVPTVQYEGKTIGFCCEDCIKQFNADPEKYMKDLK